MSQLAGLFKCYAKFTNQNCEEYPDHDVTVEEKPIPDGEVLVVPQVTQVNNRYEENAEQEPPSNKIHVTAALQKEIKDAFGSEPQEKISCEPKIEQTLSKPDVVRWVNNIPESSSKPVYIYQRNSAELHTRETLKDVTEKPQVINEPQVFTRGEYSYIPINPVINPTVNTNQIAYYPVPMYRFGNNLFPIPANYDAKSIPKQYIPIRFIDPRQIQKENIPKLREIAEKKEFTIQADEEKILSNNNSSSLTIRTVGTLPSIGQKRKLENNVYLETEIKETVPVPEKRIPMPSFPAAIYDTFLRDVEVTLNGRDLWGKFHAQNTEMVITRSGRRIFPSLQVTVSGMNPNAKYVVFMDLVLVNDHRYKFEYESSQWLVACDEVTKKPEQLYIHPESPNLGNVWMKAVVDFTKCKLTNNISDRNGHMVVHSMHKYQPRIIVAFWDQSFELLRTTRTIFGILSDAMKNDFDYPTMKKFIFPETQFIAVTAYQNTEITNLKIQSNPFARGFRLEGKGGKKRLMKNNGIEGSMDANQDFDNDSENEFNASEDNCASQVVEYEQYRRMNKLEDDPINRGNVISIQAKQNSGEQEGIRSMADLNQFRENESINKFEGHRPDVGVNANQYNEFLPVRFDPGGLVKQEQVTIQSMKDNFTQKVEDGLIANLHHTNQTSTEYNLTENKEQGYQGVIPVSQSHDKITSKFQIPSSGSNSFDALVTNSAALPNLPKESMDSNGNIKVENYS